MRCQKVGLRSSTCLSDGSFAVHPEATSNQRGIDGVGSRKQCVKYLFCLAEAKRELDRKCLRASRFITLQQDAAGKRLVVQFTSADRNLTGSRGLMGFSFYLKHGRGASATAAATREIVENFCTPFRTPPYTNSLRVQGSASREKIGWVSGNSLFTVRR